MNQNPTNTLPRVLGSIAATALVVGTVLGSGIFRKPGGPEGIAASVPASLPVAGLWILGGLLVFLGALALAEVASVLPHVGGNYVFLGVAYGRMWGFLWGWVDFGIIRSASLAALATAFSDALANQFGQWAGGGVLGSWPRAGLTIGVIVLLGWVNIRGVRWGSGLQVLVTTVKVGSLLFILALPYFWLFSNNPGPVTTANLNPVWPEEGKSLTFAGLGTAFIAILWAYHGWGNIAPASGEITNPQRNIPRALLAGVGIVVFLYLTVNFAYYLIMNGQEMEKVTGGLTVAEVACGKLLGQAGLTFAALAIMISTFGALNGNILVGPRLLFAMGQDGLVPSSLSHIHPVYKTPDRAIIALVVWACILVVGANVVMEVLHLSGKTDPFDLLTNYAMFGSVVFETLGVLAIFVLRRTHAHVERPYRCPGYPWVPLLYVVLPAIIVVNYFANRQLEAGSAVLFVLVGVVVYFALGLNRTGTTTGVTS